MSAISVQPSYPIFTDIDGKPLESGYIWIGTVNLNPLSNPITVYWDAALTVPASQPIRTLNGYPSNSGTPGRLYVNSDYSIQVLDKNGSLVYSAPAATERYGGVVASQVVYNPAGTGAVSTTVQSKLRESVSVKDFGAVGDGVTDDTAAITAAFAAASNVYFPAGNYAINTNYTLDVSNKTMIGDGYTATQLKIRNAASLLLKGNRNIFQNIGIDASSTSSVNPIRFGNTGANPFWDNAFTACRFVGNSASNAQTVCTFNFTFINTFTACLFQFGGTVMRFETDANRNSFIGCSIRATQDANNVVLIEHTDGFNNAFVSCDAETCTRLMNVSGGLVTFKDTYFESAQRSNDAGYAVSASFTGGYVSFDQCFINEMIWSVWSGVKLKMTGNYIKKSVAANFLVFREATIPWIHFDGNVVTPAPGLFMQVASPTIIRYSANGISYANGTISNYCYVMQERCRDVNTASDVTFMLSNTPSMAFVNTSEMRVGDTSAGSVVGQKLQTFQSTFSASPLILGTYYFWVDNLGNLRIKNGVPTSATDGVVVGTQT